MPIPPEERLSFDEACQRAAEREIDTTNKFAVGASVGGLTVKIAGLGYLASRMNAGGLSNEEALNLAAWLIVMSEINPGTNPTGPEGANAALVYVRDLVYAIKRT